MHAGLKRNFQVMPGAEWLALLCKHVPDRYEHLVRYVGWYSNPLAARADSGLAPIAVFHWREGSRHEHGEWRLEVLSRRERGSSVVIRHEAQATR